MPQVKRPYHAPQRVAQAAQTRQRVIAVAADLFCRNGWLGTTVADIANGAGVTPQAVHNSVGGKPALLIEAVRSAAAGEESDRSLVQRSDFEGAYRSDATVEERAAAFAAGVRAVYERTAPLFLVLAQAAPTDHALTELWDQARGGRLQDCTRLVTGAGRWPRADAARRADLVFVQSGPSVYLELVRDRHWTGEQYENWLAETITGLIRPAPARSQRAAASIDYGRRVGQ